MRASLILDVGSTHEGSLRRLQMHIDAAKRAGPVAVKTQLFETAGPNIVLPPDVYKQGYEYAKTQGVTYFSSVFTKELAQYTASIDRSLVKIAYPTHATPLAPVIASMFDHTIVSVDLLDASLHLPDKYTPLLCIPQYPLYHPLVAERIPWEWFGGFSSHCMGIDDDLNVLQAAADKGCEHYILEKHVRLEGAPNCPDACFAINWDEVQDLMDLAEGVEWVPLYS